MELGPALRVGPAPDEFGSVYRHSRARTSWSVSIKWNRNPRLEPLSPGAPTDRSRPGRRGYTDGVSERTAGAPVISAVPPPPRRLSAEFWAIIGVGVALAGLNLAGQRSAAEDRRSIRADLQGEIQSVRADIESVRADIHALAERVARLEGAFATLRPDERFDPGSK